MRYVCRICDGLLQDPAKPLVFSPHLGVWSCTECQPILATIEPEKPDAQEEGR